MYYLGYYLKVVDGPAGGSDAPLNFGCVIMSDSSIVVGPSLLAYSRGLVQDNSYFYIKDLLDLDAHWPKSDVSHLSKSKEVGTPLSLLAWAEQLLSHPDRCFAEFILQGIQKGFRIGFDRRSWLQPASSNLSVDNPQIMSEYLLTGKNVVNPSKCMAKRLAHKSIGPHPQRE